MNCISPPGLEDTKLLAHLDGVADHETESHLEQCKYCNERAKALARQQNRLMTRLYRIDCPSPLELGEYRLQLLTESRMQDIKQHLNVCPHCEWEVAELTPDVSPNMFKRLWILIVGLFGRFQMMLRQLRKETREVWSPGIPALSALRGGENGPITLVTDGIPIILDFQSSSFGQLSIHGQVAVDDYELWNGTTVELRQTDAPQRKTLLDDLGAFRFEEARPGLTQIKISDPVALSHKHPVLFWMVERRQ
jgi:hypothetical protein